MYGLTNRLPRPDDAAAGAPAPVVALHPRGTVLLIERDPLTLGLVRGAIDSDHRLIVAGDADQALDILRFAHPDVLVLDRALPRLEAAVVTKALAACTQRDTVPTIVLDPDEPLNAAAVRARVSAALRVTRRTYLGGGLRSRMAA